MYYLSRTCQCCCVLEEIDDHLSLRSVLYVSPQAVQMRSPTYNANVKLVQYLHVTAMGGARLRLLMAKIWMLLAAVLPAARSLGRFLGGEDTVVSEDAKAGRVSREYKGGRWEGIKRKGDEGPVRRELLEQQQSKDRGRSLLQTVP